MLISMKMVKFIVRSIIDTDVLKSMHSGGKCDCIVAL